MKQVTFSIDDDFYARAEKLASEQGVSIEEMTRELLAYEIDMNGQRGYRAKMDLIARALASRHGMSDEWNREEAYAGRLSRHERSGLRGDRASNASSEMAEGDPDDGTK